MDDGSIREAYDYLTSEGWWVVSATYPTEELVPWLLTIEPDLWVSEYDPAHKKDWDHTILFKDPRKMALFRLRWYEEHCYVKYRQIGDHVARAAFYFSYAEPDLLKWDIPWEEVPNVDWPQ